LLNDRLPVILFWVPRLPVSAGAAIERVMNISYKWLKEFVDPGMPVGDLAEKLTLIGLELDGLHSVSGDDILDIETTSNRGDCLSHLGVAREVAAATGAELRIPGKELSATGSERGLVTIEADDICRRFTARVIRGVKIGPSPEWLVKRLEAVGERSINNIADITNYVMHALGQPMHAFDLDKLEDGRIVVRKARKGEKIVTLDEEERELDEAMLVICDASRPCAVGGVMGGLDSGIGDGTVNVLLEVAYFEPESIRRTSKELGLSTEASYRFERGVDIENLVRASDFAAGLIAEIAGGEISEFADEYPVKPAEVRIDAPDLEGEIRRLSGLGIPFEEAVATLERLGIRALGDDVYVSPTWRHDLFIEEDLVEEVVRIAGYDRIGEELPPGGSSGEYQPTEERKRRLRNALSQHGFDEAISYSFIDAGHDGVFATLPSLGIKDGDSLIEIRDPIIEGASRMRPSLLPGLLAAVRTNFNQRNRDLSLFEIGKIFASGDSEDGLPEEREFLALAVTGSARLENNTTQGSKTDFFDLKGAIELAFEAIRIGTAEMRAAKVSHLQAGQSAEIVANGSIVGYAGRLDQAIADSYKFKQPVFVAEIDLQALLAGKESPPEYTSLPVYPSVHRDVTMAIKRNTTFAAVRSAIAEQGFELCRKVSFVDVFEGKGLADDERALTIRLEYRSDERTLTEEEVDSVHSEILRNLSASIEFERR